MTSIEVFAGQLAAALRARLNEGMVTVTGDEAQHLHLTWREPGMAVYSEARVTVIPFEEANEAQKAVVTDTDEGRDNSADTATRWVAREVEVAVWDFAQCYSDSEDYDNSYRGSMLIMADTQDGDYLIEVHAS